MKIFNGKNHKHSDSVQFWGYVLHIWEGIKCTGEIDIFSNAVSHRVSYVLSYLNIGAINGMTHIKTIFNSMLGTGKHLIGNKLHSCDDSITQVIHILYFSW